MDHQVGVRVVTEGQGLKASLKHIASPLARVINHCQYQGVMCHTIRLFLIFLLTAQVNVHNALTTPICFSFVALMLKCMVKHDSVSRKNNMLTNRILVPLIRIVHVQLKFEEQRHKQLTVPMAFYEKQ